MKLTHLLFSFVFLLFCVPMFAQCPPPGFPTSGNNCGSPVICENLDGYCNTINNNNQSRAFPCCAGFTLNNDEWFGFFAGSTTITIDITPSNCLPGGGGQLGLQSAIYATCPPANPSNAWCNANLMDSQCSCSQNTFTLTSNNFVIGQVYWFVFDGCSGSVCDYSVDVTAGQTTPFPPDDPGAVTGPTPICQGTTSAYSVPLVNGATTYTWTMVPTSAGTITGSGRSINVTWAAGFSGNADLCVKVSNACYQGGTSCMTVNVLPKPTASISSAGPICMNNGSSVNLTVTLTGEPDWTFVYAINGVNQPAVTTSNTPYTLVATQAGTYTIISVKSIDSDPDCAGTVSGSAIVTAITLTPIASPVTAFCGQSNGSVDLSVTGGNNPYGYSWSSGQTTQDLSAVPPGTYTVTITENAGCTATLTATVNNAPIFTAVITNNTSCNTGNGAINLSVSTIDSLNFAWSNGSTTEDLSNLLGNAYTVTITLGANCTATGTYTVIDEPLNISVTHINSSCDLNNGSINATVSGGAAPYTYLWSNGATTEDLFNIAPGNYLLTVTGANACTKTVSVDVPKGINPCIFISGKLIWEGNRLGAMTGVANTLVTLSGDDSDLYTTGPTNIPYLGDPGNYKLFADMGSNYTITPVKNRPYPTSLSGVTAADAARIQQHISNIKPITDPYKLIAADVSDPFDNQITASDVTRIQQAILGYPAVRDWFAAHSWRFIPQSYVFPNPNNPWGFPESISRIGGAINQSFIGVKLGDVNSSASPASAPGLSPNLVYKVQDRVLEKDATFTTEFNAYNFDDLIALQFGLQYDQTKLKLNGVETITGSPMQPDNFGLFDLADGEIRACLAMVHSKTLTNGTAGGFRLNFQVLQGGSKLSEVLQLSEEVLHIEAYSSSYRPGPISLEYEHIATGTMEPGTSKLSLLQNAPNPFFGTVTNIGFVIPENCDAQVRVFDISGRLVEEQSGTFTKGYNHLEFRLEGFSGEGVLFYELITPYGNLSKKMVFLRE